MRLRSVLVPLVIVLFLLVLGFLFTGECSYGGGMAAAYRNCDCFGIEWELYDQTAADGPRKTICIGIVQSTECYQYLGGPRVDCN
jgi:hypothetical protein